MKIERGHYKLELPNGWFLVIDTRDKPDDSRSWDIELRDSWDERVDTWNIPKKTFRPSPEELAAHKKAIDVSPWG